MEVTDKWCGQQIVVQRWVFTTRWLTLRTYGCQVKWRRGLKRDPNLRGLVLMKLNYIEASNTSRMKMESEPTFEEEAAPENVEIEEDEIEESRIPMELPRGNCSDICFLFTYLLLLLLQVVRWHFLIFVHGCSCCSCMWVTCRNSDKLGWTNLRENSMWEMNAEWEKFRHSKISVRLWLNVICVMIVIVWKKWFLFQQWLV